MRRTKKVRGKNGRGSEREHTHPRFTEKEERGIESSKKGGQTAKKAVSFLIVYSVSHISTKEKKRRMRRKESTRRKSAMTIVPICAPHRLW